MGRLGEQTYRRKLHRYLSRADDLEFLRMLWAVDALQSQRVEAASRFLTFPQDAAVPEMTSPLAVYKWELEALANELLTVPKERRSDGKIVRLDCRHFTTAAEIARTLRKLENAEYGSRSDKLPILMEMHRIGQRQFEWQRGFFNRPEFYRAGRIFGGKHVNEHYKNSHGLSFQDFTKFGFAVHGTLLNHPGIDPRIDMTQIGIDHETKRHGFQLVSRSLATARDEALHIRPQDVETAYRPSLLRRWPLLEFDPTRLLLCPVISLLAQRVSSGIFYDLLGARGEVWDEVGERFEDYARELIATTMTSRTVIGESTYRIGKNLMRTPDVLVFSGRQLELIVECKAKRMTFEAKFGADPISSAAAGYKEMARAVVQIWRYAHDARAGLVGEVNPVNASGLVLTLDNWLATSKELQTEVLTQANLLADSDRRVLVDSDRVPIAFAPIQDLEAALAAGTDESLVHTVRALANGHRGWLLPLAQDHFKDGDCSGRKLPLGDNLGYVFDWWDELDVARKHPK